MYLLKIKISYYSLIDWLLTGRGFIDFDFDRLPVNKKKDILVKILIYELKIIVNYLKLYSWRY